MNRDVILHCSDRTMKEFIDTWAATNSNTYTGYVLDVIHYALNSYLNSEDFWGFLLEDTYTMERVFAIDQADLIAGVLINLEIMNHAGFQLPYTCYMLHDAIDAMAHCHCTEATKRLLESCVFEIFDGTRWYDTFQEEYVEHVPQPDNGPELVRSELPPEW